MSFYGHTADYWLNLDGWLMEQLWMAIEVLEARDMLSQMKIADWPNMKKNDRSKLHRKLHKVAFQSRKNYVDIKTAIEMIEAGV